MGALVTFIIPVRHQENSRDWNALKANLAQTVASIAAQTDKRWRAIVVANHGADLPTLPEGFEVVRVDFPPNRLHEQNGVDIERFWDAVRLDKGRRILAGMLHARDTQFFMISDDDDCVSHRIVEYVAGHQDSNGWRIDKGYVWGDGGRVIITHDDFSNFCGTSLIIRKDLYQLPSDFSGATESYIKDMLGSHVRIAKLLAERGTPLSSLPFRGAIYRVGHAGSHSKSRNILRMYIFNRENLIRPRRLIANLLRIRWRTPAIDHAYFATPEKKRA